MKPRLWGVRIDTLDPCGTGAERVSTLVSVEAEDERSALWAARRQFPGGLEYVIAWWWADGEG